MDSTSHAIIRRVIRVNKEDSAYVYNVLESHEGIAFYSTLHHQAGELHRDIELSVPVDFIQEVDQIIKSLEEEGVPVHEVRTETPVDRG